MGAGVGRAFEFGIQDGYGRWQLVVRHVVVADYEVDAERGRVGYFIVGLDAAVEYYD